MIIKPVTEMNTEDREMYSKMLRDTIIEATRGLIKANAVNNESEYEKQLNLLYSSRRALAKLSKNV